jgi:hypothetical protein
MADEQQTPLPQPTANVAPAPELAPTSEPSTMSVNYSDPATYKREGDTADQTVHYGDPTTYGTRQNTPEDVAAYKAEVHKGVRSRFSNFIHEMFTGEQPQTYHIDENGQQVADPKEPLKPGQLFRHILAGALLGGAMGARGKNAGEGAALGLGAVMERADTQEAAARQRAQQGFENKQKMGQMGMEKERLQLEKERSVDQHKITEATLSQYNWGHIIDTHRMQQENKEAADHAEATYNKMQEWLTEHHAKLIPVDGNGQEGGAGVKLLDSYLKDPQKFSPPGYSSLVQKHTNYEGLTWNAEVQGWFGQDGKRVNPQDRTTISIYQVPEKALDDNIHVTGAEMMRLTGEKGLDPKKDISLPVTAWLGAVRLHHEHLTDAAQGDLEALSKNDARKMKGLSQLYVMYDKDLKDIADLFAAGNLGVNPEELQARRRDLMAKKDAVSTQLAAMTSKAYQLPEEKKETEKVKESDLPKPAKKGEEPSIDVAKAFLAVFKDPAIAKQKMKEAGYGGEASPAAPSTASKIVEGVKGAVQQTFGTPTASPGAVTLPGASRSARFQ